MTETNSPGGDVEHYMGLLKRGAVIVALTALLVAALGVAYAERQPARYQASADVFLSTQSIAAATGDQLPGGEPDRVLATQAKLAQLPEVIERARSLAKLPSPARSDLITETSVDPSPSADLLTFSVTAADADAAVRFARAYATAYSEFRRKLDTSAVEKARSGVRRRLSELRGASDATRQVQGYSDLLQREQDLRSRRSVAQSNAAVGTVSAAAQTQPNPKRNGFLGAIMGLMLGIALASVRERFNTRVRSTGAIEQELGLPLVGRLPAPPRPLRQAGELAMLAESDSSHAEAVRIFATNLEAAQLDSGASSILFTSSVEGEGKTTTIANVAVALARFGRSVVLVDLDLRRPALGRFFDLEGKPGLTSVMFGDVPLDDALVSLPVTAANPSRNGQPAGSLRVLTSGALPSSPADLLASPALDSIMKSLRGLGDLILVDTPPMLQVSDAVSISTVVDSVLIVARVSKVRRPALQELRRVLDMTPVSRLGVVVTGTEADESYSYRYGYSRHKSIVERVLAD